ncbi:helix-turn-helix transcriptional regulator [Brachybacterium sp. EF45031]|nr:helix-turn-helix transcriptional regulator [Brachybacterium sillae]
MIGADAIRGHIDLIVLAILDAEPSYAYALARTITERAAGRYEMKQTTLYTALKRLEQSGDLASFDQPSESGKPRTYYALTPQGRGTLAARREEWARTRELVDHFAS